MTILFRNINNLLNTLHVEQEFIKNYYQNHIYHFTYFLKVIEGS